MYGSGDVYEGMWADDKKHGTGTFFYMSRGKRFDGVWQVRMRAACAGGGNRTVTTAGLGWVLGCCCSRGVVQVPVQKHADGSNALWFNHQHHIGNGARVNPRRDPRS